MIRLDVSKFCEGCPEFEADVEKISYIGGYDIKDNDTTIRCKYRERCKKIAEYLAKRNNIKFN